MLISWLLTPPPPNPSWLANHKGFWGRLSWCLWHRGRSHRSGAHHCLRNSGQVGHRCRSIWLKGIWPKGIWLGSGWQQVVWLRSIWWLWYSPSQTYGDLRWRGGARGCCRNRSLWEQREYHTLTQWLGVWAWAARVRDSVLVCCVWLILSSSLVACGTVWLLIYWLTAMIGVMLVSVFSLPLTSVDLVVIVVQELFTFIHTKCFSLIFMSLSAQP